MLDSLLRYPYSIILRTQVNVGSRGRRTMLLTDVIHHPLLPISSYLSSTCLLFLSYKFDSFIFICVNIFSYASFWSPFRAQISNIINYFLDSTFPIEETVDIYSDDIFLSEHSKDSSRYTADTNLHVYHEVSNRKERYLLPVTWKTQIAMKFERSSLFLSLSFSLSRTKSEYSREI